MNIEFPKVDDDKIYPEITKYILNGKFVFDIDKLLNVNKLNDHIAPNKFIIASECFLNVPDNFTDSKRTFISGPNWMGKLVDYVPVTAMKKNWTKKEKEWLYTLTYDEKIVKIGMTSSGLSSRFASYNCGTKKAMIKGSCATTNYVVTQCNYLALMNNMKVKIYVYEIPERWTNIEIFNNSTKVLTKVAHKYESILIEKYKNITGNIPPLCSAYGPS